MPEGDTIFRAATSLRKALCGRVVQRFETSVQQVANVDARAKVAGREVTAVEPRGKHLLITFSAAEGRPEPLVLHTHLRMTGSWHIYRPFEPWQRPAHRAVVVVHTEDYVAPCFSAPVCELLTQREAEQRVAQLGPDVMMEDFDVSAVLDRVRRRPELEVGVALLNQRLLAGVGNVYKSEALFCERLSPFRLVSELKDEALLRLLKTVHLLMQQNRTSSARRTVPGLDPDRRLWVYGRSGEPCRVCGDPLRMRRQGLDGRSTYYCPRCQQVD